LDTEEGGEMRKSVRKDDPGYDPKAVRCAVFLDGQKLKYCITADEELGKAWVYETGEDGHLIVDRSVNPPQLRVKVLSGKVRIVMEKR